jgi:hypothetical protein
LFEVGKVFEIYPDIVSIFGVAELGERGLGHQLSFVVIPESALGAAGLSEDFPRMLFKRLAMVTPSCFAPDCGYESMSWKLEQVAKEANGHLVKHALEHVALGDLCA